MTRYHLKAQKTSSTSRVTCGSGSHKGEEELDEYMGRVTGASIKSNGCLHVLGSQTGKGTQPFLTQIACTITLQACGDPPDLLMIIIYRKYLVSSLNPNKSIIFQHSFELI